jgi:hypothetical protein
MSRATIILIVVISAYLLLTAGCGGAGTGQGALQAGGADTIAPADAPAQLNAADQGRSWVAAGLPSLADVAPRSTPQAGQLHPRGGTSRRQRVRFGLAQRQRDRQPPAGGFHT